jgi:ribonuclease D
LLDALQGVSAMSIDELPKLPKSKRNPESAPAITELLKVALKLVAEREGVAPRIIANAEDLETIAIHGDADVKAMHGWRRELFGDMALKSAPERWRWVYAASAPFWCRWMRTD